MHFMNNPCLDFEKGSLGYLNARKEINCLLIEDGCVQAIRKIKPGTELLTGYHTDQHRPKKHTADKYELEMNKKPAAKKAAQKKTVSKEKKPAAKKYASRKHSEPEKKKKPLPERSLRRSATKKRK